MSRRFRSILVAGIASLPALFLSAGREACAQQATLSNTAGLNFGRFVVTGLGTVTVSPTGGVPQTSGVILLNSPTPSPATFTVGGNAGKKSVMITFPASSIQLTSTTGGSPMTVDTFVSSPKANTLVAPSTAGTVSVGATLHVNANQAAGAYSGSFSLTVNFQ